MEVTNLTWALTILFIVALLGVDLYIHRKPKIISLAEAGWSTAIWTALGIAFTAVVFLVDDSGSAGEYFTGFLLERALSVDNVLVFVVILAYFAVPPQLEHRALFWGVVGALVLRAVFIAVGAALLEKFEWTTIVFGLILIVTAYKLLRSDDAEVEPDKNIVLRALKKVTPVTPDFQGTKLLGRDAGTGKRAVTPLFAVLVVIGSTDLVFAVDSVPAVFGVTREPYIVFSANAFSLLGLRPMSSLLTNVMHRFVYLQPALAIVLALVGLEMLFEHYFDAPAWLTLAAIVVVLGSGMLLSLYKTKGEVNQATPSD